MTQSDRRTGALVGLVLFMIPLGLFLLWNHAFNETKGYPDNVNLYNSYFPGFLRGRFTTTILSFVLCVVAVILNSRNLNNPNRWLRAISWLVVAGGSLLGLLNLFSMM